jgi:hypothetical protein
MDRSPGVRGPDGNPGPPGKTNIIRGNPGARGNFVPQQIT